jgi:hypothetical protein
MALNKLKFNSLNVTPVASKAVGFNSSADGLTTVSGGSTVFIKKLTASSSSTLSFVDGSSSVVFDNTYKEYVFVFNNIHPSADGAEFQFQCSTNSGSSYGVTMTSTAGIGYHDEGDSYAAESYDDSRDIAQGTGFKILLREIGSANDECGNGFLKIFNPSNTTFVKHFLATGNYNRHSIGGNEGTEHRVCSGYFNTTSAIDAIQFKMDTGNIDAGDICLYGIL